MNILDFIPVGKENAVTRKYLINAMQLSDRKIRNLIHEARRDVPIINTSNGVGYYIPDMKKASDVEELKHYIAQEESRAKSIFWSLFAAKNMLRPKKDKQVPGQIDLFSLMM